MPSYDRMVIMSSTVQVIGLVHRIARCSLQKKAVSSFATSKFTSRRKTRDALSQNHGDPSKKAVEQQKESRNTSAKSYSNMTSPSPPQTPPTPVRPDLSALFTSLEQTLHTTNLGTNRWYLIALAALVGGNEPEFADQLYLHLISKPSLQTPAARQALVRRLREALVKLTAIVGVCKPLEAILAISKAEHPGDRDFSFSRRAWAADDANHARGAAWLQKIYAGNTDDTLALFDAHQDFRWISTEITYGLYLSDRAVLDDWDTEVVVLAGIMIQNLRLETKWHIRGARRIGMSKEDVAAVMEGVRRVAEFTGVRLHRIPSVEEVEHEV